MPDRQRVARTLLEQCIWDREVTYEEQIAEFMTFARQLTEQATLSVRHLQRLAAGQRSGERASPSTRRVMRQMYAPPAGGPGGPGCAPPAQPAPRAPPRPWFRPRRTPALWEAGRFDEAITAHQTARHLRRELGDHHGEAEAWNGLGIALAEAQRFDEATTAHETARDLYHQFGDRHGEGKAWAELGLTLREARRIKEARAAWQEARQAFAAVNAYDEADQAGRLLAELGLDAKA